MALCNPSNHTNSKTKASFTRLLAEYRARVYEAHFLDHNDPVTLLTSFLDRDEAPTILVIEDNKDQWLLTRWALQQRFPHARLHWLSEANEVIPYLDSCWYKAMSLPRMILVDLYLPSAQQGLAVLQALKSHPTYQPLPALTLSKSDRIDDMRQAFDHAADGYLVKPTNYRDWVAELSLLDKYLN